MGNTTEDASYVSYIGGVTTTESLEIMLRLLAIEVRPEKLVVCFDTSLFQDNKIYAIPTFRVYDDVLIMFGTHWCFASLSTLHWMRSKGVELINYAAVPSSLGHEKMHTSIPDT